MNTRPSDAHAPEISPKALFLLDPSIQTHVYGLEAQAGIARQLSLVGPPVDPADYASSGCWEGVEVILSSWGMPQMTAGFLQHFPDLKIVFYAAGSVRDVATPASWARGVRIVSAGAANAIPTAEFAFASIILCLKRAWPLAARIRLDRHYKRDTTLIAGTYRSTVGLLGLGRIGRLVAARLRTLSVKTIACDPLADADMAAELGVSLCPIEDVFARANVVSCHLPLLPETKRTLRAPLFRAMRTGASFINTARGHVVVEEDLVAVLRERPDLFAQLDVTYPEPPAQNSALFDLPNVMITPHIAGSAGPERHRLGDVIATEVSRYVRGERLPNEITEQEAKALA